MKHHLTPTAGERRGLVILILILLFVLGVLTYSTLRTPQATDPSDSLLSEHSRQLRAPRYYDAEGRLLEAFSFDPNEADSTDLLRLGFQLYQVRGIYKFRKQGGVYSEVDDVRNIPGMTRGLWERLRPYVHIGSRYRLVEPYRRPARSAYGEQEESEEPRGAVRDTLLHPLKLRPGETLDLNHVDTSLLKRIPGIGSYYAGRIVAYRNRLGGFTDVAQVMEADEGIPLTAMEYLRVADSLSVRQLDVNHASKGALIRHPYLSAEQANAIWQYVHNFGPLHSLDDLPRYSDKFQPADLDRLRPYLLFR